MSRHLASHLSALPPPASARAHGAPPWLHLEDASPVAVVLGTFIVIALAILSALTLLAVAPAGIAVPSTLAVIGGLVAGILAIRARLPMRHHARSAPRPSPESR